MSEDQKPMRRCDQCYKYTPEAQMNEIHSGVLCNRCFESWLETADESTIRANPEIWPMPDLTLKLMDVAHEIDELARAQIRKSQELIDLAKRNWSEYEKLKS